MMLPVPLRDIAARGTPQAAFLSPISTRGKNETYGVTGLRGRYFRGIDVFSLAIYLGEEDGDDTHDTSRPRDNTKSFDSSCRKENVGYRRRRFYLRTLWLCCFGEL
jgi:hypothetical protein